MLLDLPPGTSVVALDVHQLILQSKKIIIMTQYLIAAFVAARTGGMAIQTNHFTVKSKTCRDLNEDIVAKKNTFLEQVADKN